MKKIISILLTFAAVAALYSCGAGISKEYADYITGGAELTDTVTDLTIDWINGTVRIEYGDTDKITFSESSEKEIPSDCEMCYKSSGNVLSIAYSKSKKNPSDLSKDLKVTLPRGMKLGALYIDTVAADVDVSGIAAPGITNAETVSGNVHADLIGSAPKMMITTVSGKVVISSELIGEGIFETTSGNIDLFSESAPKRATVNTMSGNISLYLSKGASVTVDFTTISGTFSSDFDMVSSGTTHKIGSGDAKLIVTTISGNLKLGSAKSDSTVDDIVR